MDPGLPKWSVFLCVLAAVLCELCGYKLFVFAPKNKSF